MTLGIEKASWAAPEEFLEGCCHLLPPPEAARSVASGWVTALGPAYETRHQAALTHEVVSIARGVGFRETNPADVHK